MKRIINAGLAALVLAAGLAGSAQAGQYVAVDFNNTAVLFADVETLQPAPLDGPDFVTFWDVVIAVHDGGIGYGARTAYLMRREEFDCDGQRSRALASAAYTMTDDGPPNSESTPGAWDAIIPDSFGDNERKIVCDAAYRSTLSPTSVTAPQLVQRIRAYAAQHPEDFGLPKSPPAHKTGH